MKYYIKDNIVYVKYISTLDGKIKTLQFDVNEDKDFLKDFFKEKDESKQIFILDDYLREKEHPTDEDIEYTTVFKLAKVSKDDETEKQKMYDFYKIKFEDEKRIYNEISKPEYLQQKIEEITEKYPEEEKQNEKINKVKNYIADTKRRMDQYENEMNRLFPTSSDIIKRPKSDDIRALEYILKYMNANDKRLKNITTKIVENIKDQKKANEEISNNQHTIQSLIHNYNIPPDKLDDIKDDLNDLLDNVINTRDFMKQLNGNFIGLDENKKYSQEEIMKRIEELTKMLKDTGLSNDDIIIFKASESGNVLRNFPSKDTIPDLNEIKICESSGVPFFKCYILNEKGLKKLKNKKSEARIYITKSGTKNWNPIPPTIYNVKYETIENILKELKLAKDYFKVEEPPIIKKVPDVEEPPMVEEKKEKEPVKPGSSGDGLKDKIKSSINSEVNKKIDLLIKQMNELKDDYINFKESIKKQLEKPQIKVQPQVQPKKENDFLDLIKNFSKNKLKHSEQNIYVPEEKKSLLEETFEKRRKDIEVSEDEDEEISDWDD